MCHCALRWLLVLSPPKYPLLQQCSGEQADADRGWSGSVPRGGRSRGGRSSTGCGQRRRGSHLQLLLLPLQPLSGLPLHHDDPHQLVHVRIYCLFFLAKKQADALITEFSLTLFLVLQARNRLPVHGEHYAGRVGEDQLQLDWAGRLCLDPCGPAGAHQQRLQLKTVNGNDM